MLVSEVTQAKLNWELKQNASSNITISMFGNITWEIKKGFTMGS